MIKTSDIEIATEILAMKISKNIFNQNELPKLLKEKDLVSIGNEETINKVINIYGPEFKEEVLNGKNKITN